MGRGTLTALQEPAAEWHALPMLARCQRPTLGSHAQLTGSVMVVPAPRSAPGQPVICGLSRARRDPRSGGAHAPHLLRIRHSWTGYAEADAEADAEPDAEPVAARTRRNPLTA